MPKGTTCCQFRNTPPAAGQPGVSCQTPGSSDAGLTAMAFQSSTGSAPAIAGPHSTTVATTTAARNRTAFLNNSLVLIFDLLATRDRAEQVTQRSDYGRASLREFAGASQLSSG